MKPRHSSNVVTSEAASAKSAGLRYVTDAEPGIRRIKAGDAFRYTDAQGRPVRDGETLKRIRTLAIPPAWTNVWICSHENAHLQATGRDARGRKQHRYHPLWRQMRDATKYDRMVEFGAALPRIRQRVSRDLARPGLSRDKVLATIVRLMDLTFIRVGNDEYAKQNRSYGLTTMKDKHAKVRGDRIQFSFRGKSGKLHNIEVEDPRLACVVKNSQDIPGQELFQYLDDNGARRDITSGDVNEYLRGASGQEFTAKDFRTWAGTVLTARKLRDAVHFQNQRQAKKLVQQAINAVAEKLGNTPAVCRKCYVHPSVLDGFVQRKLPCEGTVTRRTRNGVINGAVHPKTSLACDERDVLDFLRCCRREKKRMKQEAVRRRVPKSWQPR